MKKRKFKKKAGKDMTVKPETTWQIVKTENGDYHWFKIKRTR